MLDSQDFKRHIEYKDRITKHARAKYLYGQYTFDTALPQAWVENVKLATGYSHSEIVSEFVWLYFKYNPMGMPAPLSMKGCDILEEYERSNP